MNIGNMMGTAISFLAPVVFFGFIYWCLLKAEGLEIIKGLSKRELLFSELILALSCLFINFTIRKNQFIYFWDYSREWNSAIQVSKGLLSAPLNTLKDVYYTINHSDYNHFMPMLLALPMRIFGMSFTSYITMTQVFYMCPAVIMIALCMARLLKYVGYPAPRFPWLLLFASGTPILYYVLLDGFMDPPILMLISAVLLLSFDFEYKKVDISRSILIAVALLVLVLFRRHFAYWVVGFICSQTVVVLFQIAVGREHRAETIKGFILNMLIIGGSCAIILGIFFREFLKRSLFNNFSEAYAGYNVPWAEKFSRLMDIYGGIFLTLALVVPPILMFFRHRTRPYVCAFLTNIAVASFMIWNVLQMNYHHNYLIVIQLLLLSTLGVAGINSFVQSKKGRVAVGLVIALVCGVNFMGFFVPKAGEISIAPLFARTRYHPKYREDIPAILHMVDDLNEMSGGGNNIYVLASSATMNSNILALAHLPETTSAMPQLYATHDVDLRDGFPQDFLRADILVVCDPIQLHLATGTQEVVRYLAEQILNNRSYLGSHYVLAREYMLQNDVTAKVYRRTSDLTSRDYLTLRSHFDNLYPKYPKLFRDVIVYEKAFFPEKTGNSLTIKPTDGLLDSQFSVTPESWRSTGKGFLVYGPYKLIRAGKYKITFRYAYSGDLPVGSRLGYVDACLNGTATLNKTSFAAGANTVIFTCDLANACPLTEFRMYANVPGVAFTSMTVANATP